MNEGMIDKNCAGGGSCSGKEARVPVRGSPRYLVIKRVFDFLLALVGFVILLIPMIVIGVIVRLDSPGKVIFSQERLGKDGKPFVIYKFRSMTEDAEADGPRWAEENDPRCTKVGGILRGSRLDELPQLWNILKGDMSFVGPRPERAHFYDEFSKTIPNFRDRLVVQPGLTGLAQVNGGYNLAPAEKLEYDLEYIQKRGVLLDCRCLIKTVRLVFTREGAR